MSTAGRHNQLFASSDVLFSSSLTLVHYKMEDVLDETVSEEDLRVIAFTTFVCWWH